MGLPWDTATADDIRADLDEASQKLSHDAPHPDAYDCVCCGDECAHKPSATVRYKGEPVCGWACLAHRVTRTDHWLSRSKSLR